MKWLDTTGSNITARDGEYTCFQPWLEMTGDKRIAYYTVKFCKYHTRFSLWEATWWHGNMGHTVGESIELEKAKEMCRLHFNKMFTELSTIINPESEE